jgi:type I restriction enzyme S subunit
MNYKMNEYELGDCCRFIDYRGKTPTKTNEGIPLVTAKIIKEGVIQKPTEFIAVEAYSEWMRRGIPQEGDVIITTEAPLGEVAQIKTKDKLAFAQRLIILHPKRNILNQDFLYYLLRWDETQKKIAAKATGTTVVGIKAAELRTVQLQVPPMRNQQLIAATLSCLDDKIELNNRIIANLEAQAQAIFKSWLVDFEPFQDGEFEETELGLIPKGWRVGTFSEIIEKLIPGDWGKDSPEGNNSQEVFCIRGADIPEVRNGNKGKMPVRYILPKNFVSKQLEANDLVAEISGGSPTQSTGRIALITKSLLSRYNKPMVCTNFCKAMKPKEGFAAFIYYYWQYLYDLNVLFSYENGTTGIKNLNINGFVEVESIVIPDDPTASKFNDIVMEFQETVFSLGKQNEQLALTRDTLLPKLMSGEIEVTVDT